MRNRTCNIIAATIIAAFAFLSLGASSAKVPVVVAHDPVVMNLIRANRRLLESNEKWQNFNTHLIKTIVNINGLQGLSSIKEVMQTKRYEQELLRLHYKAITPPAKYNGRDTSD